jgi:hypothetical protein
MLIFRSERKGRRRETMIGGDLHENACNRRIMRDRQAQLEEP